MFGCGPLCRIQSAAGWILSEDSYARLLSASITEYHLQCQELVLSLWMGFKLSQLLVGYSLSLCSIFVLVFLVEGTNFVLKVL